jgi:hypothetical protein
MTNIQLQTVQYVVVYEDPKYSKYIELVDNWMCTSQIVQSTDFASFSFLGIAIIVIIGTILIHTNLCLETIIENLPLKVEQKRMTLD